MVGTDSRLAANEEAGYMAESEEPERAARQLEQELNSIAGFIDQSSSPSGPTLEDLIRKLDQVRSETRSAVADTQARQALEARQAVMMDHLVSRVQAEHDPAMLQRTLQGLYASRDADENDSRWPAADSDYSRRDDSYRHSRYSSNEPAAFHGDGDAAENDWITYPADGNEARGPGRDRSAWAPHQTTSASTNGGGDDGYIPVPQRPVPAFTADALASQAEDSSRRSSPVAAFSQEPAPSRSRAIRRALVVIVFVLILALALAAVLAFHH
jgi:hypothetical protein